MAVEYLCRCVFGHNRNSEKTKSYLHTGYFSVLASVAKVSPMELQLTFFSGNIVAVQSAYHVATYLRHNFLIIAVALSCCDIMCASVPGFPHSIFVFCQGEGAPGNGASHQQVFARSCRETYVHVVNFSFGYVIPPPKLTFM